MKLSTKIILPIILISALLILLAGCTTPDEEPGYTPGTITGIIASPCCTTSGEPVSEPCCVSPEYWCFYCQQTWSLQEGIEVVLTYGEDEVATVFTNEDGEFTFTNVDPGKNYVVTAYCPDFTDNRPLVKDVALELIEGSSFDTNITDLVSTSLGLVVDFLVLYTEWGPEDISLDEVLADRPNFPNFPKFKALIYEVRRVVENCEVNLLTDDDVQYATCRAAEEISGLEIGCGPGYAAEGEGECEDPIAEAGGPYTDEVCPGADSTISFNGIALGTGGLTYDWDFGDGTGALDAGATPSHEYLNPFTGSPYTVTLTVTDECGSKTDTATVTITECINDAPVIDNLPPTTTQKVKIWQTYTYDVDATDPDGDTLTYSLTVNPNGMVIDPSTGVITWTCANCDDLVVCPDKSEVKSEVNRCIKLCDIPVTVKVTSGGCCGPLFDEESFIVIVEDWLP